MSDVTTGSRQAQVRHALRDVAPQPGVDKPDIVLAATDMQRTFGGLKAVDVAALSVQRHSITALIGPNGAGKTTLFNLLTGFDRPQRGRWVFDGTDVSRRSAHRMARAGMVRTFQLTKSLAKISVVDNVRLGAPDQRGEALLWAPIRAAWRDQEDDVTARADELLARFKLDHMRDAYAGTLSGGQRKLLEMARALMSKPTMLMLDEPMAGVNPALTQSLLAHIEDLRESGLTIVFVEHDMDVVMGISDWVVCMAEGAVIAEGPPASVAANEQVIEAYLGSALEGGAA